jgi:hypothetical protein
MLTKNRTVVIFGILVAILPFLGFPYSYEKIFISVSGVVILLAMYLIARESRLNSTRHAYSHTHTEIVESGPMFEEESVEDVYEEDVPVAQSQNIVSPYTAENDEEDMIPVTTAEESDIVIIDESLKID